MDFVYSCKSKQYSELIFLSLAKTRKKYIILQDFMISIVLHAEDD